jgi:hypothetical protein
MDILEMVSLTVDEQYTHEIQGNLHLNIHTPKFDPEVYSLIEPFVYEWTGNNHMLCCDG